MTIRSAVVAVLLGGAIAGCCGPNDTPGAASASFAPAPVVADEPIPEMAGFGRLVGGEWQVDFPRGDSAFHAWSWGPGKHSVRRRVDGSAAMPWSMDVMYWHPGLKQVRVLTMHSEIPAIGRGLGEGTFRLVGDKGEGEVELMQPRGVRKLANRWAFDGNDRYHDALLEDNGSGYGVLAEWDFYRIPTRTVVPASVLQGTPAPRTGAMKAFDGILGVTWEAKGEANTRTTFEWEPSLGIVMARTVTLTAAGEEPLMDAYFFRDVGSDVVRCLALSSAGCVYEGRLTALTGGGMELDLKGFEGDLTTTNVVRMEVEPDGRLHERAWTVEGGERTLVRDVFHTAAGAGTNVRE